MIINIPEIHKTRKHQQKYGIRETNPQTCRSGKQFKKHRLANKLNNRIERRISGGRRQKN